MKIPKKDGTMREVCVPSERDKGFYRSVGWKLQAIGEERLSDCVHGFRPSRSPVTNALAHVGKKYTLTVDLKDFFGHCTVGEMKRSGIPNKLAISATYNGAARQGLPSSPAAANLCAIPLDEAVLKSLRPGQVYTRYADDLTVSGDNLRELTDLRDKLTSIVRGFGQEINHRKTRIQSAAYGRRMVTGIAVDDDIHPSRADRRRLRALRHINQKYGALGNTLAGFEEWCKLRKPFGESRGLLVNRSIRDIGKMMEGK
jgi:hypothetical protein